MNEGLNDDARETEFGKYQLVSNLGRGGMADVFLAVARGPVGFNKLVVIKRLRAPVGDEVSFRDMFLDEARLAARLRHPNVVQTYEVGEVDETDRNVGVRDPEPCEGRCPPRYAAVSRKARRLSLNFRFRQGSTALDSRGQRDVERLLTFLRDRSNPHLFLLGFSDNQGTPAENVELSRARARQVDEELAAHGLRAHAVVALGSEMPVASNATDAGRDRNRRVEVWLGND